MLDQRRRARRHPIGRAVTLSPMPTTAASGSTRCTRIPASFWSPTRTSFGHFRTASTPATSRTAVATAPPVRSGSQPQRSVAIDAGRSSTENVSPDRAGEVHARSRRPRPAVCASATSTSPGRAPARASAATSSLVDPVFSTKRISRHPPRKDHGPATISHGVSRTRLHDRCAGLQCASWPNLPREPSSRPSRTFTRRRGSYASSSGAPTRRCTRARPAQWRSSMPAAR